MWRDNFLSIMKEKGVSPKQLSEKSGISEKTIFRIVKNPNVTMYLDTVERLALGLGCNLSDITQDTKTVLGTESLVALQEQLNIALLRIDELTAQNETLEKDILGYKAKIDLLTLQLDHKKELLAVHEYYIKLGSK